MGSVESQVGQGSEKFELVKNVPDYGRETGLDDLKMSLSTQTIP